MHWHISLMLTSCYLLLPNLDCCINLDCCTKWLQRSLRESVRMIDSSRAKFPNEILGRGTTPLYQTTTSPAGAQPWPRDNRKGSARFQIVRKRGLISRPQTLAVSQSGTENRREWESAHLAPPGEPLLAAAGGVLCQLSRRRRAVPVRHGTAAGAGAGG